MSVFPLQHATTSLLHSVEGSWLGQSFVFPRRYEFESQQRFGMLQ